jgi:hypothetical protein
MMSLDEAITHCEEVAIKQAQKARDIQTEPYCQVFDSYMSQAIVSDCVQCADDHKQLAKWLGELKDMRPLFNEALEFLNILCDKISCSATGCQKCGLSDRDHNCIVRTLIQDMKDVKINNVE